MTVGKHWSDTYDLDDIDPDSGLVRVGPDEFWRISSNTHLGSDWLTLDLIHRVKERRFFRTRTMTHIVLSGAFPPNRSPLEASQEAIRFRRREQDEKRKTDELVGDYPPKKWNGS